MRGRENSDNSYNDKIPFHRKLPFHRKMFIPDIGCGGRYRYFERKLMKSLQDVKQIVQRKDIIYPDALSQNY